MFALRRQFKTLRVEDTTVILNSLNEDYLAEAEAYCKEIGVRYFITESDGTAQTGKNSFLDRFEADSVEYAVLVDGDDYLTPRGIYVYDKLATLENPPDAVALTNQVNITFTDRDSSFMINLPGRIHLDPASIQGRCTMPSTVVDWEELAKGEMIEDMNGTSVEDVENFKDYIRLLQYGMGIDEISTRITFMSRKIIPFRFKKLIVGEDTLQFLELKEAFDKGLLDLRAYDETNPTYMYDLRISGIALSESRVDGGFGFLRWMVILRDHIKEMMESGRLRPTRLPLLEI